jgi:UDPglucose 6-dehydrogenase
VASNPAFLQEGFGVDNFFHPDHILMGVEDAVAEQQLREIYSPIITGQFNCPVHSSRCPPGDSPKVLITSIQSAELIKHVTNSFLALKISYANVIADLCENLNANVIEVTQAMGLDPRIGPGFLQAGLGFGGFRLPRDLRALNRLAERAGIDFGLLREVERVNRQCIDLFFERIQRALWVIKEKRIGVLGLAYKPDTDDIRFSPAIELIKRLQADGACVQAYDPQAMEKTRTIYPQIECGSDPYGVSQAADALLITTAWEQFRKLDWARICRSMARPLVFDGRNLLVPADMKALGFEYHSLGRPTGS